MVVSIVYPRDLMTDQALRQLLLPSITREYHTALSLAQEKNQNSKIKV